MRKRPTSVMNENRNVVLDPPASNLNIRRKIITPSKEREGEEISLRMLPQKEVSGLMKSLISHDGMKGDIVSDFEKKGRKQSPMALRTSFEKSSFMNVKVSFRSTVS